MGVAEIYGPLYGWGYKVKYGGCIYSYILYNLTQIEVGEIIMTYPNLVVRLDYIKENAHSIVSACDKKGISVCGIVKGMHSEPKVAQAMVSGGVRQIGDARLMNLKALSEAGVEVPLLLTRIPMLSEVEELVKHVDISLNSEMKTVSAIDQACIEQEKAHKVVLMCDLGDLREGYFDKEELIKNAIQIEEMKGAELAGIGTNLGCYGSIKPNCENLTDLVKLAGEIEARIGRTLEIVSGGATSSLPLVFEERIPKGINHLRIGEAILLARDLPDIWKVELPGTHMDTVKIEAQIVEIKKKPSYPVGEIFIDAFGNRPHYEDRGWETRAILALGRQDFAMMDQLIPCDDSIKLVGCSSDHLIVSLQETAEYAVGDILAFEMYYGPMLFLSGADHIRKTFVH
jgi:predicted amino acid racemase